MKVLVVYSSLTGNTKMIAESIAEAIPNSELYAVEDAPPAAAGYDIIFPGFWVDKGHADDKMLAYMETIKGKKAAPFFTLGAWPDSEHADHVFEDTQKRLEGNEILGHYRCQGKVDPKLLERMAQMTDNPHAMTPEREARIKEAAKHPDANDCAKAKTFAQEIMAGVK